MSVLSKFLSVEIFPILVLSSTLATPSLTIPLTPQLLHVPTHAQHARRLCRPPILQSNPHGHRPLFRQRVRRILRGTFIPKATPQHVQDDLLDTWHQREEFTAKMVQFGFIALFSCGFPLAPFFALLNNAVEIRFGAYRLVAESRRPFVSRTQGIGRGLLLRI
ncbi:calcium-activated chloride channel-domain-containing protein [Chytridium lagenaria]|nr:calcium-activated chloride channel-domain-containing protein [Chytridium lagenaria]